MESVTGNLREGNPNRHTVNLSVNLTFGQRSRHFNSTVVNRVLYPSLL